MFVKWSANWTWRPQKYKGVTDQVAISINCCSILRRIESQILPKTLEITRTSWPYFCDSKLCISPSPSPSSSPYPCPYPLLQNWQVIKADVGSLPSLTSVVSFRTDSPWQSDQLTTRLHSLWSFTNRQCLSLPWLLWLQHCKVISLALHNHERCKVGCFYLFVCLFVSILHVLIFVSIPQVDRGLSQREVAIRNWAGRGIQKWSVLSKVSAFHLTRDSSPKKNIWQGFQSETYFLKR